MALLSSILVARFEQRTNTSPLSSCNTRGRHDRERQALLFGVLAGLVPALLALVLMRPSRLEPRPKEQQTPELGLTDENPVAELSDAEQERIGLQTSVVRRPIIFGSGPPQFCSVVHLICCFLTADRYSSGMALSSYRNSSLYSALPSRPGL